MIDLVAPAEILLVTPVNPAHNNSPHPPGIRARRRVLDRYVTIYRMVGRERAANTAGRGARVFDR